MEIGGGLHFIPQLCANLLPRLVTIPFVIAASEQLGRLPKLAASLTTLTSVFWRSRERIASEQSVSFCSAFASSVLLGIDERRRIVQIP